MRRLVAPDFRAGADELSSPVNGPRKPIAELAKGLGISESRLQNW